MPLIKLALNHRGLVAIGASLVMAPFIRQSETGSSFAPGKVRGSFLVQEHSQSSAMLAVEYKVQSQK